MKIYNIYIIVLANALNIINVMGKMTEGKLSLIFYLRCCTSINQVTNLSLFKTTIGKIMLVLFRKMLCLEEKIEQEDLCILRKPFLRIN